ncbi:MAG TPA: heparan-alpha-glucosaminide N-acetyltransferase domain-containing protein [Chitinophagaceae bacterium]|jgi:uncharacterized membrane protein
MSANSTSKERITSVDLVRGIVMIIMALDHCRDLLGNDSTANPTNLQTTTIGLFFTRWITHLCAPTFVFLSGTSAFLAMKNRINIAGARNFLLTRGIWLVIVNFTINNFAIFFDIHFGVLFSQVIAAIGFGFICLGLLLKLPVKIIALLGLIIIFGHDLFLGVSFPKGSFAEMVWTLFMNAGLFQLSPNTSLLMSYPIIPWLGIMLVGFGFGALFNLPIEKRKNLFLKIGLSVIGLFIIIRFINFYGDPSPWSIQKTGIFTILSFINTTKYPPSLLFSLMTLGISITLIAIFENRQNKIIKLVSVYGKVPLFYWLLHWFIIHFVAMAIFMCQGYHWKDLQFGGFAMGHPKNGGGLGLPGLYIAWLSVVIFLYPISRWYGNYKWAHKENKWLSYL